MGSTFSTRFKPQRDLPALDGKVYLVTGGNSGIGMYTILHLARRGATVYMGARNESKATGAIAQLEAEGLGPGNGRVVYHQLDLSDPRLAKKSAEEFMARETRLDALINNAASMAGPYGMAEDGIQQMVVTNHISPFVLTNTLLPLLKKTASEPGSDVRIVNVSSTAHNFPASEHAVFDSKEALNNRFGDSITERMKRYGYTKLMNILHMNELQRRLDAENSSIICISLHPGSVSTPGALEGIKDSLPFPSFFQTLVSLIFKTSSTGALTSAFAAGSPVIRQEPAKYKAAYLVPYGKLGEKRPEAKSEALAKDLWNTTEKFVAEIGL
ncbi:NAD(P)-binding protein [Sistotremastrum suecicum HHB10207 ss-3]|uniref:NAD(P)-binding protein n=1 Tax=Sistotremastrum suecicum HHB10207 ss-3 TaxID=1314776 RepID=A0A165X8V6_9AGAM|nr:NAD(P)-binding protein [Sistotremastrum suecicum HHB10207 ss-3]